MLLLENIEPAPLLLSLNVWPRLLRERQVRTCVAHPDEVPLVALFQAFL